MAVAEAPIRFGRYNPRLTVSLPTPEAPLREIVYEYRFVDEKSSSAQQSAQTPTQSTQYQQAPQPPAPQQITQPPPPPRESAQAVSYSPPQSPQHQQDLPRRAFYEECSSALSTHYPWLPPDAVNALISLAKASGDVIECIYTPSRYMDVPGRGRVPVGWSITLVKAPEFYCGSYGDMLRCVYRGKVFYEGPAYGTHAYYVKTFGERGWAEAQARAYAEWVIGYYKQRGRTPTREEVVEAVRKHIQLNFGKSPEELGIDVEKIVSESLGSK